jgi:hypothetical protein
MSLTVCLSPTSTLAHPEAGGHLWVYLNWALGLRALGCRVIWLEGVDAGAPECEVQAGVSALKSRLEPYDLADGVAVCCWTGEPLPPGTAEGCLGLEAAAEADLLLNLRYGTPHDLVGRFRRSALVDVDPGLLQIWMSAGKLEVAPHDVYFTIGETVGRPESSFPDCGLRWHYTPPPVFLSAWPSAPADPASAFTTVSNWWAEWIEVGGQSFSNEKRTSFLEYLDLPSRTSAHLELALRLGNEYDEQERRALEARGWKIRHALDVSSTPEQYRSYVRGSRGELSCAKPAYVRLQTGWVSDRTVCYLASGKPAVVQHTGPSSYLPDADGLFRFQDLEDAAHALSDVQSDYERHCRRARALAEEYFDARKVVGRVLEQALA